MVNLQARADLRAAIKRLVAAVGGGQIGDVVAVQRSDVDLLLALVLHHVLSEPVDRPTLHPRQR